MTQVIVILGFNYFLFLISAKHHFRPTFIVGLLMVCGEKQN